MKEEGLEEGGRGRVVREHLSYIRCIGKLVNSASFFEARERVLARQVSDSRSSLSRIASGRPFP